MPDNNDIRVRYFWLVPLAVIILWVGAPLTSCGLHYVYANTPLSGTSIVTDNFSAIDALFSALGLAGVLYAILQTQRALSQAEKQLAESQRFASEQAILQRRLVRRQLQLQNAPVVTPYQVQIQVPSPNGLGFMALMCDSPPGPTPPMIRVDTSVILELLTTSEQHTWRCESSAFDASVSTAPQGEHAPYYWLTTRVLHSEDMPSVLPGQEFIVVAYVRISYCTLSGGRFVHRAMFRTRLTPIPMPIVTGNLGATRVRHGRHNITPGEPYPFGGLDTMIDGPADGHYDAVSDDEYATLTALDAKSAFEKGATSPSSLFTAD